MSFYSVHKVFEVFISKDCFSEYFVFCGSDKSSINANVRLCVKDKLVKSTHSSSFWLQAVIKGSSMGLQGIFKQSSRGLQFFFNSIVASIIRALHLESYQSEPKILCLVELIFGSESRSQDVVCPCVRPSVRDIVAGA